MGFSLSRTQSHLPPITEELGLGIPSHSTQGPALRAGAVPRAGVWHWELRPVAHTPWGLDGCHQLHTWPGTAALPGPQ